MELITSVRVLWICLLLVGSGESFPATKEGSESQSSTKAPNEGPQSYKPDKFIMPSDSNQGFVSLTAPPNEAGDQPPSREDTDLGVSSSSLVHSVSPAWNNPPMLDFGDGPVPYIGDPEAYHFGPGFFPFGAIESVQKAIAESTAAATGGRVERPVPYDGATQYSNVGYPVTNEGQTGLDDGPFPYDGAKPVSIEFSSSGRVDGPLPYDDDTQYANAAPINAGQTGSNPAAPGGLYDRPDPYGGVKPVSIKVAHSGRVDGPVPFGSDTQYRNTGYPVINKGQTGRNTADGPVPYRSASHYTNEDPTKDSQSGNPGSVPSGAAPEVISYGYGGYPFGNMDVAPPGRVDGPFPYGVDIRYAKAAPINGGQTRSNPGGLDDGTVPLGGATHYSDVGYPVTNKDQTSVDTADGVVPYEPTDPVVFPWAKTSFMKPNNWRPPFWGFAQWEPITETPTSDKSPPLFSSYIVQSRNGYQREKEVLSHSSFSPESDGPLDSEFFEAPRRRKTPGSLSIAGTNVF